MTHLGFSRRSALAMGTSAAALLAVDFDALADVAPPIVTTTNGPVAGNSENGTLAFKGIRYGAPPVGALRFMPPQKPSPWTTLPPYGFGPPAMQMPSGSAAAEPKTPLAIALQSVFPTLAEVKINSEDCLFLNVWTGFRGKLNDGAKRPVMVWLHGGGYAYGSGAWPSYDGGNLAKQGDVVVVTLNHRLNAFGFLELADVGGADFTKSGNVGMLDIVAALEWVRDNIGAFGGDAGNVTIFGESGGGAKVSTLMAMPSAQGLFHKAIVESGPGLKGVPKAAATQDAKDLMAELKVADVKALQAIPAAQIVSAALAVSARRGPGSEIRFLAPVVDGDVLPTDPFDPVAPAMSANVPLIIGTNKDEMTLFMVRQAYRRSTECSGADDGRREGARAVGGIAAGASGLFADLSDDRTRDDHLHVGQFDQTCRTQGGAECSAGFHVSATLGDAHRRRVVQDTPHARDSVGVRQCGEFARIGRAGTGSAKGGGSDERSLDFVCANGRSQHGNGSALASLRLCPSRDDDFQRDEQGRGRSLCGGPQGVGLRTRSR